MDYDEDDNRETHFSVPIVDISTTDKHANQGLYSQRSEEGSASDETNDTEDVTAEQLTGRSGRSSSSRQKRRRQKGGIDLTPPDKLLRKAEKKAIKYKESGKFEGAITELIRCTALCRLVFGDGHWRLAQSYMQLAHGYLDFKNYLAQAQYHCENARNVMLSGVQTSESQHEKAKILLVLLDIYYTLGKVQILQKKYTEAEQALQKSEKIAKERSKLPSVTADECMEWDIKIAIAQGKLSGKQQKSALATTYFEKAIDLTEKQYGRDSIKLISLYQDLGQVEQSKDKHPNHERAIEMYLQAHSIAGANYSTDTNELAQTGHSLANAYSNVRDPDAETSAESYLNESLAVYQSNYGPCHAKTLEVLDDLARLMIRTEREEEAISMLRSTISPKIEVHGEFSDEVAGTYKMIGSVHLSRGAMDKALKAFNKCHSIESLAYGENHKKTKDTKKIIDMLMSNPSIASSLPKSKQQELNIRPRFNTIVNRSKAVGGFTAN